MKPDTVDAELGQPCRKRARGRVVGKRRTKHHVDAEESDLGRACLKMAVGRGDPRVRRPGGQAAHVSDAVGIRIVPWHREWKPAVGEDRACAAR